ncbi:hypothetical protein NO1_0276 [Candidatus Termititenax aidoneus]|uniref:Uncharacterized protein n=1 Tax=Termititenax aidoneus TaxID=2218524 RepID=A0A388T8V5_TERA1|nr:hypothetical protein NO1_0276 [Candidatus Termititenax aidoneus]
MGETTTQTLEANNGQNTTQSNVGGNENGGQNNSQVGGNAGAGQSDFEFDSRLYTENGQFNRDGAKEYLTELQTELEAQKMRAEVMRQKLSGGPAPKTPEEYFSSYQAPDKYKGLFSAENQNKEAVAALAGKLAQVYHANGLNHSQAADISNAVLETLEAAGAIDTRSEAEIQKQRAEWVADQQKQLGENAGEMIAQSSKFVQDAMLDSDTKKQLLSAMEYVGAPLIKLVHTLKRSFGQAAGASIPANVNALPGGRTEREYRDEYMDKNTSDERRREIVAERARLGRAETLF